MSDSDRFKNDYQKYADQQVRDREHGDAMGRLRLAFFVAVLGPGAFGLMHTIGFVPPNMIRYAVLATIPLALILLVVNFVRLPGNAKGSSQAVGVLIFTLLAAAATFPVGRLFSLLPT